MRSCIMIISILILSIFLQAVPYAEAQIIPEVELECQNPGPVDVYPGATRTTIIYCTIDNQNPYSVTVELMYQSGALVSAGPGSMTIGAGIEASFEVIVRADLRMAQGSHQVSVTEQVVTAQGVSVSAITQPSTYKVLVTINQFSRLRVEAPEPLIILELDNEYEAKFYVYNDGNAVDRFNIEVLNEEELTKDGWVIMLQNSVVEVESLSPPGIIRINIISPNKISSENYTTIDNGSTQKIYFLQIKVTSAYSVETEGIPNYMVSETMIKLQESKNPSYTDSLPYPNSFVLTIVIIIFSTLYLHVRPRIKILSTD
jgi:hypothetical protein